LRLSNGRMKLAEQRIDVYDELRVLLGSKVAKVRALALTMI
jgi:hypothetical protein